MCIWACVDAGQRAAVFAPTNNSVEQILGEILSALPEGDPLRGSVVRLGISTGLLHKASKDV